RERIGEGGKSGGEICTVSGVEFNPDSSEWRTCRRIRHLASYLTACLRRSGRCSDTESSDKDEERHDAMQGPHGTLLRREIGETRLTGAASVVAGRRELYRSGSRVCNRNAPPVHWRRTRRQKKPGKQTSPVFGPQSHIHAVGQTCSQLAAVDLEQPGWRVV